MSSISLGVAALVAIDSFSANVMRSVHEQARALLGGDVSVERAPPLADAGRSLLDSLRARGARDTRVTTFSSMALVPRTGGTRLVQVRAMGPGLRSTARSRRRPPDKWKRAAERRTTPSSTPSLLVSLDAQIGDTLSLGYARFAILGTLRNVPGDVGVASAIGPRVYIPDRYLGETQLLGFGSRAEYEALVALPAAIDADALAKAHRDAVRLAAGARAIGRRHRALAHALDRAARTLPRTRRTHRAAARRHRRRERAARVHGREDRHGRGAALPRREWRPGAVDVRDRGGGARARGRAARRRARRRRAARAAARPRRFIPVDVVPQLEWGAALRGLALGTWVGVLFALGRCSACATSRRCRCCAAMTTARHRALRARRGATRVRHRGGCVLAASVVGGVHRARRQPDHWARG